MALALVVLAQCFMAPPLAARCEAMVQQNTQLRQRLPSGAEMKDKGEYMVLFGKYADEKTWDELLTDDPPYCEWVLGLGRQRLQSLPGAPELQKWLREQKMHEGDNVVWFGKYANEKTWDEVLTDDPAYCEWVLRQEGPRFQSFPGAPQFQKWLREQKMPPAKKTPTEKSEKKPKKSGAKNKRSEPEWLYHYTSTPSAEEIRDSGSLNPSIRAVSGDAREGDGIYFTSLKQDTPYSVLHENNYDGARRLRAQNVYVRVRRKKIPAVVRAPTSPDRDVWVLPTTEPLDLEEVGAQLSWKTHPPGGSRHGDNVVYEFGSP